MGTSSNVPCREVFYIVSLSRRVHYRRFHYNKNNYSRLILIQVVHMTIVLKSSPVHRMKFIPKMRKSLQHYQNHLDNHSKSQKLIIHAL